MLHDDQQCCHKQGRSSDPSGVNIILGLTPKAEKEFIKEWISVTKRMRPSPENLSSIKMSMDETYGDQRLWITTNPLTVAEIFQQYPHFVDLPYVISVQHIVLQMHSGSLDNRHKYLFVCGSEVIWHAEHNLN